MERKFSQYLALSSALRRAKVPNYGACATLLLECFLEDAGRLQASKVIARNVCEDSCFSQWRNEMIKGGWLIWNLNQHDKGQYFSGKKLIPYLNKEKFSSKEIATRDEVVATRDEVVATRDEVVATRDEVADLRFQLNLHEKRLAKIDEAVQELRLAVEPPETEEKRMTRERVAEKLSKLAVASN
jgi:hypothetical protein